jgi:hypothetical protein
MAEESRGRNKDIRTVFGFSYSFSLVYLKMAEESGV